MKEFRAASAEKYNKSTKDSMSQLSSNLKQKIKAQEQVLPRLKTPFSIVVYLTNKISKKSLMIKCRLPNKRNKIISQ